MHYYRVSYLTKRGFSRRNSFYSVKSMSQYLRRNQHEIMSVPLKECFLNGIWEPFVIYKSSILRLSVLKSLLQEIEGSGTSSQVNHKI